MAEALKRVKLNGEFAPEDIGQRIGMSKEQSEVAARTLSNAGVLVVGFDGATHFTPEFRKMTEANMPKPVKAVRKKRVAAVQAV